MPIRYAVNVSILFTESPFLDRFGLAAAAGFSRVELWFPYEFETAVLQQALISNSLSLALFNLHPGDFAGGDRGLLCDPARRDEFHRAMDAALEIAGQLDCHQINTMVGRTIDGLERTAQTACLVENLQWAAPRARQAGVTLLIEPLNPYDQPGFFLTTSREAYTVLKAVGGPNVKLQFDFYHLQITEGNLTRNFLEHLDQIGHVQIADVPGRHEPGTGEINYPFILKAIEQSSYGGLVSLEYTPLGSTDSALAWLPRNARMSNSG